MACLDEYDVSQATHRLQCAHQIGWGRREYTMPCIVLKKTKSGRLKVVVFGERDWKDRGHIKRVRYVFPFQVKGIG